MKGKIIKITTWLISKLQKFYFKLTYKEVGEVGYSSLSPIDNYSIEDSETQTIEVIDHNEVINNDDYLKALLWALKNRRKENIKNIALTGSYGSGKSSILKTFQKHYKSKDLKFLEISLATFKEENPKVDENGDEIERDKDQLLRLIETSILEQIFYHEEDDKVPDSRFKKIKSYSKKQLFGNAACLLLFVIAILNYFFPYLIQSIFKDHPLNGNICNWLHYGGIIVILLGVFFIIYKSIRLINSITLNKLNIQNAEIGFGDNNSNKSILNHHIDEILYFFSVRPYNVVIIEDLDRFRETEIFTKLREVNLLLNGSERTKRKDIVFIYAVRDEMFTDKERAKFFDFIIPIIPIINSSNSGVKLLKKKEKHNYQLSDRFIEDISFYIDDMRLLNNICNEFYLYKQKLNENLNQDKLFAIITYKNIYPNDFVLLNSNEGDLYKIIHSKREYVKTEIEQVNNLITSYKDEIATLEKSAIKDIKVIRKIYILEIIRLLNPFYKFYINEKEVSISDLVEDVHFNYVVNGKLKNFKYDHRNYGFDPSYLANVESFITIEKNIDPNQSYAKKEKEISDFHDGKINILKKKIQDCEKQKTTIRNFKLIEFFKSEPHFTISIEEGVNKNYIYTLLKNGYVSEDYIDYISLFHEGSITRTDHQYIISLRNDIKLEPDYKLNKLDKIIEKLNPLDFETEYILNYNLVDFLLYNSSSYTNQLQAVFNKLKDESGASIEFINGFIETSENLEAFIKNVCNHWINIWAYINSKSLYTDERKLQYFKLVLEYADLSSIKEMAKQSNFEQTILSKKDFLSIMQDEDKLVQIIEELGILFTDIDFQNSPDFLLEFIYKNSYYQIDISIIVPIIKKFGKFDQVAFDNSNYIAILKSECSYLIEYIENNIQQYIDDVYLEIETNVNEDENSYLQLLNNKEINLDDKILLIQKVNTKITTLSNVKDSTFYPILFSENKVIPKWENLLLYYNIDKEITDQIIIFLNNIDNANELSKIKIPTKVNENNTYATFWKELIQREDVDNECYDLILKSTPWCYSDLDINNLSEEKVVSLIKNDAILSTKDGYLLVKGYSDDLIISLIEQSKIDYIGIADQILWDSSDINLILKSDKITNSEKNIFLDNCADATIANNKENLNLINQIMLDDPNFTVNDNLIKLMILERRNTIINRIQLFNKYPSLITSLDDFIDTLSENYLEISNNSKRAVLNDTQYNRRLLDILISRNYIASYSDKRGDLRVYHSTK